MMDLLDPEGLISKGPIRLSRCLRLRWVNPYICDSYQNLDLSKTSGPLNIPAAKTSLESLLCFLPHMKSKLDKRLREKYMQSHVPENMPIMEPKHMKYMDDPHTTFIDSYVRSGTVDDSLMDTIDGMDEDAWKDVETLDYDPDGGLTFFHMNGTKEVLHREEAGRFHTMQFAVTWMGHMITACVGYYLHLTSLEIMEGEVYPKDLLDKIRENITRDNHDRWVLNN